MGLRSNEHAQQAREHVVAEAGGDLSGQIIALLQQLPASLSGGPTALLPSTAAVASCTPMMSVGGRQQLLDTLCMVVYALQCALTEYMLHATSKLSYS